MKASQATAEVFFTAFKALENTEKEAFLKRVVCDPEIREDLIDLALIEEAKKVKGRAVSAKDYFARRTKEQTT